MDAIRRIKTGRYGKKEIINHQVAESLLASRTELSIIVSEIDAPLPCYDSPQILVEAIVLVARETDFVLCLFIMGIKRIFP